uniref:uncharacterized protein LOC114679683 n=1 Tax=Macaca mulatta TaxID=9544 RepID=UPI0010A29474|nr:uncharacterized protein LOC114679683 [Macaca mulatta]
MAIETQQEKWEILGAKAWEDSQKRAGCRGQESTEKVTQLPKVKEIQKKPAKEDKPSIQAAARFAGKPHALDSNREGSTLGKGQDILQLEMTQGGPGPPGVALPPCQQVLVIPPQSNPHPNPAPPWPFTLHLHPHSPRAVFSPLTPPSPLPEESTSLQTDRGGERGREKEGAPRLPRERTEPPVPGREPKGSLGLPGASREGPGCSSRRRESSGSCGRRRRPRGRGPAAGAVPAPRRCRPAAELRPVPRPVPAREPPRRQPRRRCSVRCRQRPPSRPPSVPPAGCGGRRDGLHQPRLYSGPWAAGRGRECGTGRAASSRRQRGTERKGRRGPRRRGCGAGASHPLTLTSPAALGALLPLPLALLSPRGRPGFHPVPRLRHPMVQERARKQDAASGYVSAPPAHRRSACARQAAAALGERSERPGPGDKSKAPSRTACVNHVPQSRRFPPN